MNWDVWGCEMRSQSLDTLDFLSSICGASHTGPLPGTCYVAQAGLELAILLPLPPKC
jgi:hypothetical protein